MKHVFCRRALEAVLGDAILRGDLSIERVLQMLLTAAVPYVVSTASSVSALRERGPNGAMAR